MFGFKERARPARWGKETKSQSLAAGSPFADTEAWLRSGYRTWSVAGRILREPILAPITSPDTRFKKLCMCLSWTLWAANTGQD